MKLVQCKVCFQQFNIRNKKLCLALPSPSLPQNNYFPLLTHKIYYCGSNFGERAISLKFLFDLIFDNCLQV